MLSAEDKQSLQAIAGTIRGLSIDAVQKANSGHPGLPLGCADIGAYLYGKAMRYNPADPKWMNRDRFVLSAGHGCMLQYSCLYLAGFGLTLEDLKQFRQLHSRTPGHPEVGVTPGIEATTGPLGQGTANAVGLALAGKLLAARFNADDDSLFDYKVFCLCGDGDLMEGISHEASSFAGHLQLNNLIFLYDNNKICLDGPTSECYSDDVRKRFEAYGWQVEHISGYDLDALDGIISKARDKQERPLMIICDTTIGKGSPHKANSHEAHGSPLGAEEVKLTKEALGLPQEEFFVPQAVVDFFKEHYEKSVSMQEAWQRRFDGWSQRNPEQATTYHNMVNRQLPDLEELLQSLEVPDSSSGRDYSNICLQALAAAIPQLIGGSADLSGSDKTMLKKYGIVNAQNFEGRNIKYGVREFAMAAISSGLSLSGAFQPYCGTFLTFSDYMRNAIRLAALSHVHVIYQFTHDSIFLGEDGPTHQSIEQVPSLRALPHLHVLRPGDAHEVKGSWIAALQYEGPSAIILTRQGLPALKGCDVAYKDGVGRGGYVVHKEKSAALDFTLFSSGSELHLALDVAAELEKLGKSVRVVSLPCWELFAKQPKEYQEKVAGGNLGRRVAIESTADFGWERFIGRDGIAICMEGFGASAPAKMVAEEFGFTVDQVLERILS